MESMPTTEFSVGDKIAYPVKGVVEVMVIEERELGGSPQRFYVLRLVDTAHKIMVPVANAAAVGLRRLVDEAAIEEIFALLRAPSLAQDAQSWNRRQRAFTEKLGTGSILAAAEVVRELCCRRAAKALSFSERRMLETARGLVVQEIAASRAQAGTQVLQEIDAIFS